MKAVAVQVEGMSKVLGVSHFNSIKAATRELTEVWGLSKFSHKRARLYGGWMRTAEGPKHVCFVVHTEAEWDKLRDTYTF